MCRASKKQAVRKTDTAIAYNSARGWSVKTTNSSGKAATISTNYLSRSTSTSNLINAFNEGTDNGNGEGLSYKEVSVMLKVVTDNTANIIRNEAEISDAY